MNTSATDHCVVCNSPFHKKLTVREHRLNIGGDFTYGVCGTCSLVQLLSKPEDMGEYYRNYSYHTAGGRKVSGSKVVGEWIGQMLRPMDRYYPGPEMQRGRILDVGCARGQYLLALKKRGFTNLHGIEISAEAVQNKVDASLDVQCSSLEGYQTPMRFDLITLNQVYEHFEDPHATLAKLRDLLTPGGLLVMSFPNYASVARILCGAYWPGYDAPRHYFTFSPPNLRRLAERHGVEIARIRYISRPSQFTGAMQYVFNTVTGAKEGLESGRFRSSQALDVLLMLPSYVLNAAGFGDMIEVHIRRRS